MSKLTIVGELDRIVFERLPLLTPYWMEDEQKWLVMFANDCGEGEVERFASRAEAYRFALEQSNEA